MQLVATMFVYGVSNFVILSRFILVERLKIVQDFYANSRSRKIHKFTFIKKSSSQTEPISGLMVMSQILEWFRKPICISEN